tara:strand:- start:13426 stop:13680 length:255 start_codon:yes stop_codon:yes gene_type:complete
MKNNEILKRQIIYRSTHRGNKEMDLLLGSFVKKNINTFKYSDLKDLERLILLDDETLKEFFFRKDNKIFIPENKVTKMFKKFKL